MIRFGRQAIRRITLLFRLRPVRFIVCHRTGSPTVVQSSPSIDTAASPIHPPFHSTARNSLQSLPPRLSLRASAFSHFSPSPSLAPLPSIPGLRCLYKPKSLSSIFAKSISGPVSAVVVHLRMMAGARSSKSRRLCRAG